MEPVPETQGCLPGARGWVLGLMRVRAFSSRDRGGEGLWRSRAGWRTEAEGDGEGQEEGAVFPWALRYPQANPWLWPSGQNLSWGHYTENRFGDLVPCGKGRTLLL